MFTDGVKVGRTKSPFQVQEAFVSTFLFGLIQTP